MRLACTARALTRRGARTLCVEASVRRIVAAADFTSHGVQSNVLMRLARLNITVPTAVQHATLPVLMPRSPSQISRPPPPTTAVIRWPTGSGKTLAYALPMLARLDVHALGGGLQGLVLAPTRELCLQTARMLRQLTGNTAKNRKGHAIKVAALLGRRSTRMESELLHAPPDLVVGTPRLVASLLKARKLRLGSSSRSRTVVLDEVGALAAPFRWQDVADALSSTCAADGTSLYLVSAEVCLRKMPLSHTRVRATNSRLPLIAAQVPEGAVERCVAAARARWSSPAVSASPLPSLPLVIEPPDARRMPTSLRHVTLPPDTAAADASHISGVVDKLIGKPGRKDHPGVKLKTRGRGPAATTAAAVVATPASVTAAAPAALIFVGSAGEAYAVSDALRGRGIEPAGAIHAHDADGSAYGAAAKHRRGAGRKARARALDALADGSARALVATDMLAHGVDVKGASYVVNAETPADATSYLHRAGRVGRTGGGRGVVVSLPRDGAEAARLRLFADEVPRPSLLTAKRRARLYITAASPPQLGFKLEQADLQALGGLAEWTRPAEP